MWTPFDLATRMIPGEITFHYCTTTFRWLLVVWHDENNGKGMALPQTWIMVG